MVTKRRRQGQTPYATLATEHVPNISKRILEEVREQDHATESNRRGASDQGNRQDTGTVSYTHLTLPTILRV